MGELTDKLKSINPGQKTKEERVNRLRQRLRDVKPPHASAQLVGILQGVLDLLADEL